MKVELVERKKKDSQCGVSREISARDCFYCAVAPSPPSASASAN